eukprot:jgi/Mesvir1/18223/Mv09502-RA.1
MDNDLRGVWEKQKGKCAITGLDLQHDYKWDGRRFPCSAAMDLIDPASGYEPGNVRLVCNFVHEMKGRTPLNQFLTDCQLIVERAAPVSESAGVHMMDDTSDVGSTSAKEDLHISRWADEAV